MTHRTPETAARQPRNASSMEGRKRKLRDDPRYVALRLLGIRPRSVAELDGRLREKGFPGDEVSAVLADLTAQGLLDDRAFARARVESILARRPVGRRLLVARLRQHRVADADIATVLDDLFPPDVERQQAQRAVQDVLRRLRRRSLSRDEQRAALWRQLTQRGFSSDIVSEVLAESLQEKSSEDVGQ